MQAPAETALPPEDRLAFTGSGSEYFRIWTVNLLLTLVTLGIYSGWAKVRRTRYFYQNTRLQGFAFDYHARPVAILRGRIVALGLLTAYTWGFEFSRTAGVVTLCVLLAAGPWLFLRSQQFRLANTSWRGLRFGFASAPPEAYRIVLPILALWLSNALLVTWVPDLEWSLWASLAVVPAFPWMHHRLKAYQHGRSCFGDRSFSFEPRRLRFYALYVQALVVVFGSAVLGGVATATLAALISREEFAPSFGAYLGALVTLLVMAVVAWPFFATRLQRTVWPATRLGDVRFRTEIQTRALFRLALKSVTLTLLTAGLYWPFAAVALARYRLECIRIDADASLATVAAGARARPFGATGDGAADAFGFDIGL